MPISTRYPPVLFVFNTWYFTCPIPARSLLVFCSFSSHLCPAYPVVCPLLPVLSPFSACFGPVLWPLFDRYFALFLNVFCPFSALFFCFARSPPVLRPFSACSLLVNFHFSARSLPFVIANRAYALAVLCPFCSRSLLVPCPFCPLSTCSLPVPVLWPFSVLLNSFFV